MVFVYNIKVKIVIPLTLAKYISSADYNYHIMLSMCFT